MWELLDLFPIGIRYLVSGSRFSMNASKQQNKWRIYMTNMIRLALVAGAVIASTATVTAQVRSDRADQAFAQSWNGNGNRVLVRRSHSTNPTHDVYDGQRYVGSDPSMQIRSEILRDNESNY
jgi:hypothetical protein